MAEDSARTDIVRLVDDHLKAVYSYALRLTGSPVDAEDLTQEVFLIAQQKLGQIRHAERSCRWLFAVLRNCFLRSRQRRLPAPSPEEWTGVEAIPDPRSEAVEVDTDELQDALNELPDMFRLVLVMFYFENLSYREIAEALDLPIGTVMSRLARAKGQLRARLDHPKQAASLRAAPSRAARG